MKRDSHSQVSLQKMRHPRGPGQPKSHSASISYLAAMRSR